MLITISLIATLLIAVKTLLSDLYKYKYRIFSYPFFWILAYSILYFIIPAIFIDQISYYYNWNLSEYAIAISQISSIYWAMVFYFSYATFRHTLNYPIGYTIPSNSYYKLSLIFVTTVIGWLLWVFITQAGTALSITLTHGYSGEDTLSAENKIKTLAYLLIPVMCILALKKRRFVIFFATLLIVFLDISQGSRTTAFVSIAATYIVVAVTDRKLYATPALITGFLIYSIGIFFRPDELSNTERIPLQIALLGEFRETFIPLPYAVSNSINFDNGLGNLLVSFIYPLLGPFRTVFEGLVVNPGELIAAKIGRGYAFGLNAIYESYYYFNYLGILIMPWVLAWMCYMVKNIMRWPNWKGLTITVLFAICARLALREGIITYSASFIYFSLLLVIVPTVLHGIIMNAIRAKHNLSSRRR